MRREELTGRSRAHLVELPDPPCALHAHALAPFLNLRRAAAASGFDLAPASSFRDFERQLAIWNRKFAALEAQGVALEERIFAILQWSALPGASRHHWGTDLDLIDRNAIGAGYTVTLTAAEYEDPGPFAPLARWLDEHAGRFGFFRPYRGVLSGVEAEPWHFSFAPVAECARRQLTVEVLRGALEGSALEGLAPVLRRLKQLHQRYVARIDWP